MVIIESGNRMEVDVQMDEYIWEQLLGIQRNGNFVFYFVGGCVRDLCYGIHSHDIDIVFEGDSNELYEQLSSKLWEYNVQKSNLSTFSIHGDYFDFDFASPRTDEYPNQNGMPRISMATVGEDLTRRDFTINTGYLEFSVQTIRWFKGENPDMKQIMQKIQFAHPCFEEDIQDKKLRILHDHSFEDDPSRLLRAVKYMTVLKLELELDSAIRFKSAIAQRKIDLLDKPRYMRIIWDYIHLNQSDALMIELDEYGLLPGKNRYMDLIGKIDRLKSEWHHPEVDSKAVVFVAMFYGYKEQLKIIGHLINRVVKEVEIILAGIDSMSVEEVSKKRYLTYKLLYNKKVESILSANLICNDSEWIKLYMTELYRVKVHLTGVDIKRIGIQEGPGIGELKEKLLNYKLNENPDMDLDGEIRWIESAKNET